MLTTFYKKIENKNILVTLQKVTNSVKQELFDAGRLADDSGCSQ